MPRDPHTVLCDLDGVIWLAHEPIRGSVDAVAQLRAAGRRVMFVTNNSSATVAQHEQSLASIGIASAGDVMSSSMAAATLIRPGERVLVAGGPGIVEAVEAAGAEAVLNSGAELGAPVDAVVVGLHREFDYERMRIAGQAVLGGARLIGTNRDTTYPTPTGLEPGGGSLALAVGAVGGVKPTFAGKPEQPMVDLVLASLGTGAGADGILMVGDRPDTDGLFAQRIGCRFALVESGVTAAGDGTHADLAAVVAALD